MAALEAALKESRIIGDLVDGIVDGGGVELSVVYAGKAAVHGNLLTPEETAVAPAVAISGAAPDALHTLIYTDPDPPDPANPIRKEWLHWLVTNIPGGDFAKGDEVAGHYGPVPPTGTHRYVFLLFQQPGRIEVADPSGGERSRRAHFSSKKLAVAHGLGDPVDVKWFNAHKTE